MLETLHSLSQRVQHIEEHEAALTLTFENTRDQVLRYLKRVATTEARMREREEEPEAADPKQLAAVLRTKYANKNGG